MVMWRSGEKLIQYKDHCSFNNPHWIVMVTTSYICWLSSSHRHLVLTSSIKLNPGYSCGGYNRMISLCLCDVCPVAGKCFHADLSPTDPFVQRDVFSGPAHGLLPGDQLWPLRLRAAGEHAAVRRVRSTAPRARFLRVQISRSKLMAGGAVPWGARHNLKWIQHLGIHTAKRWLPAPEERHYIADDLVLFVHSQISWLDSLWRRAESAHLQPRMRRQSGTYKTPSESTTNCVKCGDEGGGVEWMV